MSDAQQIRRAVERFQRGRRWEHSAFPTSSGGLLHTPYPRLGAGQARTSGGGGDITIGQAPIGEIVRANVHGHLSPGGEPVVWSSPVARLGFASATFPNVELRLPHSAVYGIEGDMSWTDGFLGGGRVSLLLNGVGIPGLSPIRAGGPVDNAVGRTFTLAQEFIANEGDRLMVMMDHAGDTHHDLHGVIEVATKEPLRVSVPGDSGEFGELPEGTLGSSGTSNVSVAKPAGTSDGDLLVAMFGAHGEDTGLASSSVPWTTLGWITDGTTGVSSSSAGVAWRRAGGSEPSAYSFTLNGVGRGVRVMVFVIPGAADPNVAKLQMLAGTTVTSQSFGPLTSANSMGLFVSRWRTPGLAYPPPAGWTSMGNDTQRQWQAIPNIPPGSWSQTWTQAETGRRSSGVLLIDPA